MGENGRRIIPVEVKAAAVADVPLLGLSASARQHDVDKKSLWDWCNEAGVPTSNEELTKRTEAATAASLVSRRAKVEESKGRMTLVLTVIAELAMKAEIEMIQAGKASLSELVGARTRAIHDLQILDGGATERYDTVDTPESIASMRDELRARLREAKGNA